MVSGWVAGGAERGWLCVPTEEWFTTRVRTVRMVRISGL